MGASKGWGRRGDLFLPQTGEIVDLGNPAGFSAEKYPAFPMKQSAWWFQSKRVAEDTWPEMDNFFVARLQNSFFFLKCVSFYLKHLCVFYSRSDYNVSILSFIVDRCPCERVILFVFVFACNFFNVITHGKWKWSNKKKFEDILSGKIFKKREGKLTINQLPVS